MDDRTLTQKHVNLYQPVMFSTPDSPQPVEMVINKIGKDHIHGYIAAPRFRQSELASMGSSAAGAAPDPDGGQFRCLNRRCRQGRGRACRSRTKEQR